MKDSKGVPLSVTRIESAFESLKGFVVDPKKSAATQVQEVERKLIDVGLSMKKNEMEGTGALVSSEFVARAWLTHVAATFSYAYAVTIPKEYAAAGKAVVNKFCSVQDSKFSAEAATFSVAFAPGAFDEMMAALASATKGEFTFDMPTPSAPAAPKAGKAATGGKPGKKKAGA